MTGRLRALLLVAVAAAAVTAAPALAQDPAPRTVAEPTPAEARAAAADLVDAVVAQARELERAAAARRPARAEEPALTDDEAIAIAGTSGEVREWIRDREITRTASEHEGGTHTVYFVSEDEGGEETVEAQVLVADATGEITEVRTGPQVSWMMARGYPGAFGRAINRPVIWLPLCALFLLPLLRLRRIVSMRTLDLLVLLSFGISLIWFNRGEIFTSVPLHYPPMAYLALRLAWIAARRARAARAPAPAPPAAAPPPPRRPGFRGWAPTWLLVSLLALSLALRYGLNAFDSNVIDVGYAGVIGADRITSGQTPYGTFPDDCGSCDTYGPLNYIAYVPFELAMPWQGSWDALPAAHGAATLFDILCVAGMIALGWSLSGPRLGMALGLAWAAFPFTAYTLLTNSNDALVAAMMIWGLVLWRRPLGRGLFLGLAIATKFAPAVLVPLWSRRPFPRPSGRRDLPPFAGGLGLAAALVGWVLLLDGLDGVRAFWSRTLGYQLGRDSPFSIWGQHPGLRPVQIALMAAVGLAAVAVLRWPRRLDLLTLTALSGALLVGLQLTLTHWFYLYIPWFLPFALLAMVPEWPAPTAPAAREEASPPARARVAVPA